MVEHAQRRACNDNSPEVMTSNRFGASVSSKPVQARMLRPAGLHVVMLRPGHECFARSLCKDATGPLANPPPIRSTL